MGIISIRQFVRAAPSIRRSRWNWEKYRVIKSRETTRNEVLRNFVSV